MANVRTWDHLTKNGPVINGLDEYWVWNPIMREELINFHKVNENKIYEVGSPQFDYYLNNKESNRDLMEYFKVKNPENEFSLKNDSSILFLQLIGLIEGLEKSLLFIIFVKI